MTEDIEDAATRPESPVAEEAPPRVRWWQRDVVRQMLATPPALTGLLVPGGPPLTVLAAWDVFALVYLLLTWLTFRGREPSRVGALVRATHRTRRRDKLLGMSPSQVPQSAAAMAMIASVVVLPQVRDVGAPSGLAFAICLLSVVTSWVVLQVGYTLIYAGLYADGGGLAFPGGEEPHLADFGYFAVAVGTSFGTTDVDVTQRRVRRHVMRHGVLAFGFNTLIIASVVTLAATYISAG